MLALAFPEKNFLKKVFHIIPRSPSGGLYTTLRIFLKYSLTISTYRDFVSWQFIVRYRILYWSESRTNIAIPPPSRDFSLLYSSISWNKEFFLANKVIVIGPYFRKTTYAEINTLWITETLKSLKVLFMLLIFKWQNENVSEEKSFNLLLISHGNR